MTAPYRRQTVAGTFGGHDRRISILEAVSTEQPAQFDIKVVSDTISLSVGDGKFIFAIPEDLDGWVLYSVAAYVTTVSSSGKPTIQIRKNAVTDMLSTKITIDVGEKNSRTAAIPPVINATNSVVAWSDEIAVDIDVAGTGAKGLGVILTFIQ